VSFRLELRPQVSADVFAAAAWYDEREPGLGAGFAFAVQQRLDELLQNPLLPRIRDRVRGVRWVYPRRFPYRIIYRVIGQTVLVIAIIHAARDERHWKKRV
jgi:plasmid stabilization system protein ParE